MHHWRVAMLIPRLGFWLVFLEMHVPWKRVSIYFWLWVYVTLGPGFLLKKHGESWPRNNCCLWVYMQKLGVTVRGVFLPCTHTYLWESPFFSVQVHFEVISRQEEHRLPLTFNKNSVARKLKMMGKTTHTVKWRNSLRVCELEWDEFQVQWLPILWNEEQQCSSTTVSTSGGWEDCGRTCDLFPLKGCIWVTMDSVQVQEYLFRIWISLEEMERVDVNGIEDGTSRSKQFRIPWSMLHQRWVHWAPSQRHLWRSPLHHLDGTHKDVWGNKCMCTYVICCIIVCKRARGSHDMLISTVTIGTQVSLS